MRNEDYRSSEDWLRFRTHWLNDNPPLDNHAYMCGICGHWIDEDEVTLDHIMPRRSDNMFDYNNMQPAHWACNSRKGSKHWLPKVKKSEYEFLNMLNQL